MNCWQSHVSPCTDSLRSLRILLEGGGTLHRSRLCERILPDMFAQALAGYGVDGAGPGLFTNCRAFRLLEFV